MSKIRVSATDINSCLNQYKNALAEQEKIINEINVTYKKRLVEDWQSQAAIEFYRKLDDDMKKMLEIKKNLERTLSKIDKTVNEIKQTDKSMANEFKSICGNLG